MNRNSYRYVILALTALLLGACKNNAIMEYHEGNRDNVIDGTSLMVSIDDKLPPIHSFAVPIMAGDTLVIMDYRASDFLFTAYDIYNDSTIGKFGKYGSGPGEAGNPLFRFYNKYDKNLYIGNGMRGKLSSFYLPEAVSDSTYDAVDGITVNFFRGILSPNVIDESNVLCTTYSDIKARDSRISNFNIKTGDITVLDSVAPGDRAMTGIAVAEKENLIFSFDRQHDLIRILDLDGNLRRIIYGPEYDENVEKNDYFFSASEICGDKVAVTYTGRKLETERSVILLMDLEGKYLKTLRFDATIHGIQYHDKTGRLYMTTTGEPQIGYIELDKIPD